MRDGALRSNRIDDQAVASRRPLASAKRVQRSLRNAVSGVLALIAGGFLAGTTPLAAAGAGADRPVVGPDPNYQPKLVAPVFNVKDYGARGNNLADDTDAIRAALAACRQAGGGTVYLPAGTYKVAPKEEGGYAFPLHFGNLTIEGDGPTRTIFNFRAWGMKNPENLILQRGGGFTTNQAPGPIDGITLRGFRATGNARPTKDAGNWWGEDSLTGWDTSHKGLGVWGPVTNLVVEDSEWDNWRGEVLYSGGGLELGKFTIRRCIVRGSNASAISMGGDVLVEDSDIYDAYNGTECLSMGGHQKLVVQRCVIEVNRNFAADMKIGKFGIVYLGFQESSLTVDGCNIGDTLNGGVFLSDFASNINVRNNTFEDTIGIYSIDLNMYSDQSSIPKSELGRLENIEIIDNNFFAKKRNVECAFITYRGPGRNFKFLRNSVIGSNGFQVQSFARTQGASGVFTFSDNNFNEALPAHASEGIRPTWIRNTVTGHIANGAQVDSYVPSTDKTQLTLRPYWTKFRINDIRNSGASRITRVDPAVLPLLPEGFTVEILRLGDGDSWCAAEIIPDPTWNTLSRGFMLYGGAMIKLRKGSGGLMELESFQPPHENISTLTHSGPNRPDLSEISVYGQREVVLAPTVRHTFLSHSGVAINDTVTIRHNALTTLKHVPGVLEIYNGEDFVATESGTLLATRVGEVLKILDPTPHAWMESQGLPGGTPWTADPDGDGQSLLLEYALGGHPQANDPRLIIPRRKNGVMQLSFLWNQAASDLRYDIEASSDLRTWSPILSSNRGSPWTGPARFMLDEGSTGLTWMTVTDVTGASEEDARFMRIRVEEP
jgi:hypothetical protein